jgi:hypothetical protein
MSLQPVLIAPFQTGLDTDLSPWIAPPDSFRVLNNVHQRHGKIEKRQGRQLFATLSQALRVMGIGRYINADGTQLTLAWDTTRAYRYNGITLVFDILDAASIMSSSDTNYIWYVNWQATNDINRFYFTNGKAWDGAALDGIRYYDNSAAVTIPFRPYLDATPPAAGTRRLYGAKLLFTMRQRLIALNTFENDGVTTSNLPQRMRWCKAQNPDNWNDIVAGGGGFVDAPTGEQILSARLLQDLIVVFFTNSVWVIRPTPDPALPFRWDRLNGFRSCDGKMASIGFDRFAAALGVRGITASDSNQTQRIDERIQDFVGDSINVGEFGKVFCERSYSNQRWWTLYPANESEENDSALIYDDDSKGYSTYSIDLNCLGYGNAALDYGLNDFSVANDLDLAIEDFADETLQSYYWQENQEIFLGGDNDGNIWELEVTGDDGPDPITALPIPIDSELVSASWNPFQSEGRECQMNYVDFYVDTHQSTIAKVEFFKDAETAPYAQQTIDFLPPLGFIASVQSISQANPCVVNAAGHGLASNDQVFIYTVQGMDEINGGAYTVTVIDNNSFSLNGIDSTAFGAYTEGGQVVEREFFRTRTWKRAFGGGIGFEHYIRITSTGSDRPFTFHAFKPYFRAKGRRTIN